MESLRYGFEGRGLVFADDVDARLDDIFLRSKTLFKDWDVDFVSDPTGNVAGSIGFVEPILPQMVGKSVLGGQILENLGSEMSNDSGSSFPTTSSSNSLRETGSKVSSSANQFENLVFIPSEFKKKNHVAPMERSRDRVRVPEDNSLLPSKRARVMNSQSQIVSCQVLGCNKDLSLSKDYHKRHRVCELHSKTAVVTVNGLQQRFCQQCSRFHRLPEFDEGKRSCRKRLADHNERRRKPPLDTHTGSTSLGTNSKSQSLLFPEIFRGDRFGLHSNGQMNIIRHVKSEEEPSRVSQAELLLKFDTPLQKLPILQGIVTQYPSNVPFSAQEVSADSNASSALSLLSAQSQSLLIKSASCASIPRPAIFPGDNQANRPYISPTSDTSFGKNSMPCAYTTPNGAHQDLFPVVHEGFTRFQTLQNTPNPMCYLPPESASTLDLFQLSSNLQRVERHKHSNLGCDIFCDSAST